MNIRKKMLMIALACLVCFQPTMKADDTLAYKALLALVVLYNIYPIGKALGEMLLKVGYFLGGTPKIVEVVKEVPQEQEKQELEKKVKPDSELLSYAKKLFDKNFKLFNSKENVEYANCVYKKLCDLEGMSKDNKDLVLTFLKQREKEVKLDNLTSDRYGKSFAQLYSSERKQFAEGCIQRMTNQEYQDVYKKTVAQVSLEYDDFHQLMIYMDQKFTDRRRSINRKIINVCSACIASEEGAEKELKAKMLDHKRSNVVLAFCVALDKKQSLSEHIEKPTEVTTSNLLASFGQACDVA